MSKVKITGNASGTGVLTIEAPNTNTDRTISLPDSTDTLVGQSTTNALAATDTALAAADTALTTRVNAVGGRKNLIINGDMRLNQRGAGSLTVNSGALQYPCDRFAARGVASAGVFTIEKVTDSPAGFTNSLKATVTTADGSLTGTESYRIVQHIEGNNIYYLNWGSSDNQTATLSFKVKSSLTGTFGGVVQNGDYNRFVPFTYTISSANTWEDKTVTITGDTTGNYPTNTDLSVRLNWSLGTAQLGTAGTYTSSAVNGATGQTQVISTNGATWQVTGVQLELGSTATDFEHRSYGEELALCQRYYHQQGRQGSDGYEAFLVVAAHNTVNARGNYTLPTTMRTFPTLSSGGSFYSVTGIVTTGWSLADNGGNPSVGIETSASSGYTIGSAYSIRSYNDADAYLAFDAEL
jgi:hypothetical protein